MSIERSSRTNRLLDQDLSRRVRNVILATNYMRYAGFEIINYLALLGWNPGTEQEIFTLEELINVFDLERVHKGGAIFDEKKLAWVNRKHFNLSKTTKG